MKGVVENLTVGSGLDRLGRYRNRRRALILAYHNVVPDEQAGMGDVSLHLPLSRFKHQLKDLMEGFRLVSLADILGSEGADDNDRPQLAMTFDDAYRGTLRLAVPELAKQGIPATIFVAPELLGSRTLWWDALSVDEERGPPAALRTRILEEGDGTHESATALAPRETHSWKGMPAMLQTATVEELEEGVRTAGITVGSHTWSHATLVRLSEDRLTEELDQSRGWLRSRFQHDYLNVLSYPYGHCSPGVEVAAAAVGYDAALSLERGWVPPGQATAPFRLPRTNIPAGMSLNGLRMRLAWA